ncbi:stalk domain-containing protein [Pseudobacteroides cellulosolvens]|uniref:Copper amine oxidase-like domain-containing protein n=1 Tax=Pseudobacteroides cellulosolvens ATCC 35603 = DSM 2933 TaxID=398512 RepID=A0A0L6JVP1_9FIRM|nr:stalk domain-containing protein [Pseudobacteroides cellulosolvens]KNY29903.1 copper amine oxidase-like domain-containing protein [Pseudobacteroides cellulosolvens ATCC 35603 = DSM 2933]
MGKTGKSAKVLFCVLIILNLLVLNYAGIYAQQSYPYHGKRLNYNKTTPIDFITYDVYGQEANKLPKFVNPGQFDIKWRYDIDLPSNAIKGPNGTIYLISLDGVLYAIDPNGERLWGRKIKSYSNLTLCPDGTIYAVSQDSIIDTDAQSKAEVYAFNQKGNEVCSYTIKNPISYYGGYCLAGDEKGNLIIPTEDGIFSYDKKGNLNWKNTDILKMEDTFSIKYSNVQSIRAMSSENIIIVTNDKVYSLNSSGKVNWSINNSYFGLEIYSNELGYIYNRDGKYNIADTKNGHVLTDAEIKKLNIKDFPSKTSWAGGYYYNNFLTDRKDKNYNKGIVSYDNNNKVKWVYTVPSGFNGYACDIAADMDGNVYFSDYGGNLYSLDKDGNERYMFLRHKSMMSSSQIIVANNGDVVWITDEIGAICIGTKSIRVLIDDEEVNFSNKPFIDSGTTLVPFRPVFEKLGITINWDAKTKTISASNDELTMTMQAGSKSCNVNGSKKELSVAPKIINGSTYIPLRFISETTKKEVSWDQKTKIIYIGSAEQQIKHIVDQFFSYLNKKDYKGINSLFNIDELTDVDDSYRVIDKALNGVLMCNDIKVQININSDIKATAQTSYNLTTAKGFNLYNTENITTTFNFVKTQGRGWKISSVSK